MKKYLAWFAIPFLLSILMNLVHEHYAYKAAADCRNKSYSVFLGDTSKCEDYSPNPNDDAAIWWERGYVFFGWPNGTTIWALVITFAVIGEQTVETRKAAQATSKQVGVQTESLRPRLAIGFADNPYSDMIHGKNITLKPNFINSGGMPAHGVIAEAWLEWLSEPYQFTARAFYDKGKPVSVDTQKATIYRVPLNRGLTPVQISDFRNGTGTICIRIRLSYDALGHSAHTEEAYAVEPGGYAGIPEYSSAN